MITPTYSLTATERVLPRLALDFTTALLDPRITFTRSGDTATVTNSSGVIVGVNADLPRFDYDPTTLVCKGLLIEEARTNELLNSLIDGTSLSTQLVTVTAAARTLSFYGTGEIVLSGAHSATVTGTGAYPSRKTLTFTPSAGALTLTVTGTVQFAQLEIGSFATSFIPTGIMALTRNADVATMTGTNFSDWFNATEGSFVFECSASAIASTTFIASINDGTTSERIRFLASSGSQVIVVDGGAQQSSIDAGAFVANTNGKICGAYKQNSFAAAIDGGAFVETTSGNLPTVTQMAIGNNNSGGQINGLFRQVLYYPQRLTNAEVQAFSKG